MGKKNPLTFDRFLPVQARWCRDDGRDEKPQKRKSLYRQYGNGVYCCLKDYGRSVHGMSMRRRRPMTAMGDRPPGLIPCPAPSAGKGLSGRPRPACWAYALSPLGGLGMELERRTWGSLLSPVTEGIRPGGGIEQGGRPTADDSSPNISDFAVPGATGLFFYLKRVNPSFSGMRTPLPHTVLDHQG